MIPHYSAALLSLLPLLACATASRPDPTVRVEILRAEAVDQIDSVPGPALSVSERRLLVHGFIGLGATGYELIPSATVEHGVIDLVLAPVMPENMAGLTVLTRYEYRLTTAVLEPGSYAVRMRHAREGDEAPVVVFEGRITVE